MKLRMLPQSTPYDPAEDPPGSVDPLGTVTGAEQLAEVLLPGLTARMWRVRLLTFAALAAEVSRRVAAGSEDRLVDARLVFERLFVSAVARQEERDSDWGSGSRRLPGIGLARQALRRGDQPLERANFLKGQNVNGPCGVISRLAKDVGVVNQAGELERAGTDLLLAWAEDEELPGLLDDRAGRKGANWIQNVVRQVIACLDNDRKWPGRTWPSWEDLAIKLRPDKPGRCETRVIKELLSRDPLGLRNRVIQQLVQPTTFLIYRSAVSQSYRGAVEKEVIVRGLGHSTAEDEVGRTLRASTKLIDAYEVLTGILESAFRSFLWGLTRNNGQATRITVVQDPMLSLFLAKAHSKIGPATSRFRQRLQVFELDALAGKRDSVDIDRMHKLADESAAASRGVEDFVSAVMDRHIRVQKEKNKGVWIDEGQQWTLMPGFGDTTEEPLSYDGYLHSFRITNIYGMLADLKLVREVQGKDGEEQSE